MPQLIPHIDAIARQKKRDVLFIVFHQHPHHQVDWRNLPLRQQIIDWLNAHGIDWSPCAHVANTSVMAAYRGQIYIDLPYDEQHSAYRKLRGYLEHPDGRTKIDGVTFCYYPLVEAMKNAEHDEPGFWERWAEQF